MLLICGLGHRRISALPGLHRAMASQNYNISSRSRVHPSGKAPYIPPHKPLPYTPIEHHSLCLPDIQTSLLQVILHDINSPLPRPTHWTNTSTLSYIDSLGNPVIFHPLHMAEPSEITFINLFVHTFRHSVRTTTLSVHSRHYPFSWYPAHLLGCPSVQP